MTKLLWMVLYPKVYIWTFIYSLLHFDPNSCLGPRHLRGNNVFGIIWYLNLISRCTWSVYLVTCVHLAWRKKVSGQWGMAGMLLVTILGKCLFVGSKFMNDRSLSFLIVFFGIWEEFQLCCLLRCSQHYLPNFPRAILNNLSNFEIAHKKVFQWST